jgi:TRAP-type C4-dicarboxylate transport system substrate-binding protein
MRRLIAAASLALALAAGASAAPVEMIVGGTAFRNTEGERLWLGFRDRLLADAAARVQPRMLIYGELGTEEQIVSGLRRGRVHFANLSANIATTVVPEVALIYVPYLFEDQAEADYVLDRYLTPEYERLFAAKDLVFISWFEIGFHHVYSRGRPILLPADAKGVRFRVAAGEAARQFARAIGADVIPLAYADVIPSLQTGLIAAGEQSVSLYARSGIAPEAPHLTLTGHSMGMSVIVAQKRFWDRLEPGQQRAIRAAFPGIAESRKVIRAEEQRDLEQAAKLRFQVHRLTPEQRRQWSEVTRPTHPAILRSIGGDAERLYQLALKGKQEYASRQGAAR